ncbi:DMT family transporter [Yeguia hominis]|uniref:EamA family transporter n=1 Tax=Yeguia hominis TaxID=2763662 RepID=A0A926D7W8_9FIRM|nr:EamA family transporter [Yeguia hominis]MBC8532484.1 EamA family transporter [Yeguia hominis]
MPKTRSGALCILAASLLFSTGGILIKLIPWSALAINSARCFLGAIVIGIYMAIRNHRLALRGPVLIGAICMAGTVTLFTMATKMTTAANAIVLQYTAPIFVMLFLWVFYHQKPRRADFITCLFVLLGIICCFLESFSSGNIAGDIVAILAGISYAGVCMLNVSPKADALSSILLGQLLGALAGLPALFREADYRPQPMLCLLALGVLQVGLAYVFFSEGLRSTPPVAVSLICGIEPVLNPLWVAIFYREHLGVLAIVGAAIVLVSILTYQFRHSAPKSSNIPQTSPPNQPCDPANLKESS